MAYSASPPGFLLYGQKKKFFAEATLEIHCLEDVSILLIRAANQNTGKLHHANSRASSAI